MTTRTAAPDETRDAGLGPHVHTRLPFPGNPPLFVEPVDGPLLSDLDAVVGWFVSHRGAVDDLLVRHGAIVLRGFPIDGTDDYARLVAHYAPHSEGYVGGATPRDVIKGNVYEATRIPASVQILLHQEMAYLRSYPAKVGFFCNVAPDTGGETIIGDIRSFMARLPTRFLDELDRRSLIYHRNFRPGDVPHGSDANEQIYHATIEQAFSTRDRAAIERHARTLDMKIEWLADGSLSTRLARDAFARHARTGERVYFNHILTQIIDPIWLGANYEPYLDLYDRAGRPRPYNVTYGDGGPIAESDYRAVADGLAAVTVGFPWQHGDVLLLDNLYTLHGRNPYTGARDIQVVLIDD